MNVKTERWIKEEFAFLNVNLINSLISTETVTIAESMNIQKEVSVPAMTVLPEIHPVKFVSSAVHPTNTLSTVFVESV